MEYLTKTKKPRLIAYFTRDHTSGWEGRIKHTGNDWKFQSYKVTNLGHDMICESVEYDQEEKKKKKDILNGNRIINLNNFITNLDKLLVCKEFTQEREIQIKLEEEIEVENFIDYVQAYFQLTLSYEQKGVREIHEDFHKNCITVKQLLIRIHSTCLSPSTAMV